jgi:hypothetical protein
MVNKTPIKRSDNELKWWLYLEDPEEVAMIEAEWQEKQRQKELDHKAKVVPF